MTLRVAVLTMLETAAPGNPMPRAFLRIGGLTVGRQQVTLALALALKCERVVCIADVLAPELIELQHLVEAGGAQFHLVPQARSLAGLISAVDEVFVLADGLFASTLAAAALLEEGQAVLVQSVEPGIAAGFERIDLNHAAAGAMRLPGRLVEQMANLPSDCDAASALLRIALQSGIRKRSIPAPGQDGLFWTLVSGEDEAHALEPQWIRLRTRSEGALSMSGAIALLMVRALGPALLHAGSGAGAVAIAAVLLALLAFGSGWFALIPLGLGFAALSWILRDCAVMLSRIETEVASARKGLDSKEIFGWALDAFIILLAAWGSEMHANQHALDRLFPPFILIALLRILPRLTAAHWAGWFADRALLALVLAAAMVAGVGSATIHVAATVAALAGILLPLGQSRLTRP